MNILMECHLYAAVCNRCDHIQLYLRILDTKNGYQGGNCLHFDEHGQSKKLNGFCAGTDLKHANNCTVSARSRSEEMATVWHA
jgi:hypothetical protein